MERMLPPLGWLPNAEITKAMKVVQRGKVGTPGKLLTV